MTLFWVVAGLLTAAAAVFILARAAQAARLGDASDPTPAVYRRQLAEIDELAERGLIGDAERRSAHAEAARRLLAAAESPAEAWRAEAADGRPVMLAVGAAAILTLGLYLLVGTPGYPDQPFARRLAAWRAADPSTLGPAEMAAVLQRLARERATDPDAWRYLALAEGAAQEPAEAVRALHRAIRLQPRRADLWEMLGQALVMQTGQVGPEAKAAFDRAVQLDPHAFIARFFLGRARIDAGDKAGGLAAWQALLADTPASDPRRAQLQAAIAMAQGQAPPAPAVSGDQMTAIRGMVQGLADRLKANPDDPQGWVRLVRAYAVLGDEAARDAALAQARARYAGHADILGQLEEAAKAPPMSR